MADVFISYAHKNATQATRVTDQLEGGGVSLWWDKHLVAGDDFPMVIERELNNAASVVVLWSDAARNSLWVRAEATEALDNNKLVQARIDGVKPPLPFTVVQMVDLRKWRGNPGDQPFPQLLSAIGALKGGKKPRFDERVFQGPALQDFGSTAMLGWIAILLSFGTAGLTWAVSEGIVRPELYKTLTTGAFGASILILLLTLTRLIRTAMATGRK